MFWTITVVMKFQSWMGKHRQIVDLKNCWAAQIYTFSDETSLNA
jgi:hypothetical protein